MSKNSYQCHKCDHKGNIEDMTLKMGGLLCPECRTIVFAPYVDDEFFIELKRRQEEQKEKTNE